MILVNLTQDIDVSAPSINYRESASIVEQLEIQGYLVEKIVSAPVVLKRNESLFPQVHQLLFSLSFSREQWEQEVLVLLPDFELALFGVIFYAMLRDRGIHPLRFVRLRKNFHSTTTISSTVLEVLSF